MQIPYKLVRKPASHRTSAVLVLDADSQRILQFCAKLGLDPTGRVFAVSGGLLLKFDQPKAGAFAHAIRLRQIAANLLVPTDAELFPSLLDDEATGLTRDRGLIFLPNGEVFGYDPRTPIEPGLLLVSGRQNEGKWRSFPEPKRLADRIEVLRMAGHGQSRSPEQIVDDALDPENDQSDAESAAPSSTNPVTSAKGRVTLRAGQGLMWLGKQLGMKGLAGVGAGWVRSAMEMAPHLSDGVIGRQAAALRNLLREFRDGDPEKAIRRALPMGDSGSIRGASIDQSDRLSDQDPTYSLDALLRRDSQPGRIWVGGQDLMAHLIREYHQAAERALQRGDFRRAAYIYGKLLKDYRLAAQALLRGGLYRDASSLFLAKLDDPKAAAMALESAGDLDRAIELYKRVGEHEAAGDLLRKIGEEEAAMKEFRHVADRMAASVGGHLSAGDFLAKKTGNAQLALEYFEQGWSQRPRGNAILCVLRIARHHVEAGQISSLLNLIDEADGYFEGPGDETAASQFYEEIALHAEHPKASQAREDLRDRSLFGIAKKLRQNADTPGTKPRATISRLMSNLKTWSPAVVRDAEFALSSAPARSVQSSAEWLSPGLTDRLGIGNETVTATTFAPGTDEIFFGFASGEVVCFRPRTDEIVLVTGQGRNVAGLAAAADGRQLVVLQTQGASDGRLNTFERRPDGSYRSRSQKQIGIFGNCWITPMLSTKGGDLIGIFNGDQFTAMSVEGWTSAPGDSALPRVKDPLAGHLVHSPGRFGFGVVFGQEDGWRFCDPRSGDCKLPSLSDLTPDPTSHRLGRFALHHRSENEFEIASVGPRGNLGWRLLRRQEDGFELIQQSDAPAVAHQFGAVAIVRPGVIATVSFSRVEWFHTRGRILSPIHSAPWSFQSIAACFPSRRTGELIVIDGRGRIRRVPSI